MKNLISILCCIFVILIFFQRAQALNINFNDFYYSGNVNISADGSWAQLIEDPNYNSVFLSDDPYWGASYSGISIPTNANTMTFNYEFNEPTGNVDEFYVFLYDLSNYPTPLIDRNGKPLEFRVQDTSSGTVTWDLYGASFLGTTVGMEIQLNWLQGDPFPSNNLNENSSVKISDLKVNPVPEPSTILLMGFGVLGLFGLKKKTKNSLN